MMATEQRPESAVLCTCPRIDGYVIPRRGCPHHAERPEPTPEPEPARDSEAEELACAWVEYRKDHGVHPGDIATAHKAFVAGWKAARQGDQSGVLR